MPATHTAKMTAKQFLELGEDPPGIRLELVDGEIEMAPSPIPRHSRIVMRLGQLLLNHTDASGGGEVFTDVDTIFSEHDVRRPDILYFSPDRTHLIGEKAMEGPPDLAVEVISPSSTKIDREIKYELYEKGGVAHYWIIDPSDQSFVAYALTDGRYQQTAAATADEHVHAPPFESLALPLGNLWMR